MPKDIVLCVDDEWLVRQTCSIVLSEAGFRVAVAENGAAGLEAFLSLKELGPDKVEVVVPSQSILAEPPVAIVDKVVDKKGTRNVAQAYLEYLYTPEGQEIAAKNYYRPRLESVAKKYASTFPKLKLVTIDEVFGGWQKAQKTHFADGGVFDQIYQPNQ